MNIIKFIVFLIAITALYSIAGALSPQTSLSPAQINALLFQAVRANNMLSAQQAIELGANVNSIQEGLGTSDVALSGWTPLHWAAQLGNETMINFLLNQGAYVTEDANGRTPEDIARANGNIRVADKLRTALGTSWGITPRSSTFLPAH